MENSERSPEKVFLNGDIYYGNFRGMVPHGKGKYMWSDGTVYEGDWEEGNMTGKGQISWSSGATYEGDFSVGYLHGFGKYSRFNGSIYVGSWRMNILHGPGRKQYSNSDVYEGLWRGGVYDGSGRYTWYNGNTYIGNWKGGKMWGRGVMKWADGEIFDGFWLDGLRHGSGFYRFADGGYYFGTWTRGLKDGKGTFYANGNKHPSVANWSSSARYDDKISVFSHSSLNSEENRDPKPSVKRSFSEKISIGGLIRSSGLISNRTSSLDEDWKHCDSDISCILSYTSGEDEHGVQDNSTLVYEREYMQGVLIEERIANDVNVSQKRMKQSTFHAREVKRSSWLDIFGGHRSYCLMLSLQLGIRYTVGKITPVPMREVRSSDFGDRARIRMYFPRKGSQFTPPHYSIDFYWKDYCSMVFRNLRELFKLDAAEYMMSICGDDGLRELSSPGKSGSIFYLSHDDRFVIKTLKRSEVKALLKMLPKYYDHVREHENTLITKFFGLHQITLKGGKQERFVVMGNMFCTELRIHRRYDLKGSTLGRYTNQRDISDTTTLKDLDLRYEFHMDKLLRTSLFEQISLDCMFLESQQIIDYSLLLGLHFRAPQHLKGVHNHETSPAGDDAMSQVGSLIPVNGLLLVTHEPCLGNALRGPHIRGNTLRALSVGDQEVDLLVPGTGRLPVQLGVNMPAQAIHKLLQDESVSSEVELVEVYDVILYLGMIDILQEYNMKKRIEHAYKSLKFDPLSISAIEPKSYSNRFISFLKRVFPDQP